MEVRRCIENGLLVITGITNNLTSFFDTKEFQDRVFYILQDRGIIDTTKSIYETIIKEKGILNFLKDYDLYRCYGREENKIVLLYPDLWVMVTMESSPENMANVLLQAGSDYKYFDFIPVSFKAEEQKNKVLLITEKQGNILE